MANRREFVQSAVALSSLTAALGVSSFSMANASGENPQVQQAQVQIDHCLLDSRFAESRNLFAGCQETGIKVSLLNGDVTDLWYSTFSKAWKQAPMSIAGVTGEDVLFVMEVLARDHNMKLFWSEQVATAYDESLLLADSSQMQLYQWLLVPRAMT